MIVLLILIGISTSFDRAVTKDMGDVYPVEYIIIICILAGGLFGWLSLYISSALISWTGKWIGGEADTKSILRVVAYGNIPLVVAFCYLYFKLLSMVRAYSNQN